MLLHFPHCARICIGIAIVGEDDGGCDADDDDDDESLQSVQGLAMTNQKKPGSHAPF